LQEAIVFKNRINAYQNNYILTGTGAELIPVISIDGIKIRSGNKGEITKMLMSEFMRNI
jgi:branched-subunit amino acid aminotransferase/4-amino-4-deoxychorismate lyase